MRQKALRRAASVGRHDEDVNADSVEQPRVVQPLGLVVDRPALGGRDVAPGAQVEHVQAPMPGLAVATLVGDAGAVGRERRALDVVAQDLDPARADAPMDQVVVAARGERRVELVAVAGEGDAPEVEVLLADPLAVLGHRELLKVY